MENKVRCLDCAHIVQRKFCAIKGVKIKRKVPLTCDLYEYREDKTPPAPLYVPANYKEKQKKTKSFLRKLRDAGAQVGSDGSITFQDYKIDAEGNFYKKQAIEVPATTATASVIGTTGIDDPMLGTPSNGSDNQ